MGCTATKGGEEGAYWGPGSYGSSLSREIERDPFFDRYFLGPRIGKGGFAQVRELCCKQTGRQLAVKIIDLRYHGNSAKQGCDEHFKEDAIEEALVWRQAGNHENIVHFDTFLLQHGVCFLVMERCDMSFLKFLSAGAGASDLQERSLARSLKQVLLAVQHCHKNRVVHRDIKPDNLMVRDGVVKLVDFGLAAVLPLCGGLISGVCGTAYFMAPEMLILSGYDGSIDIWAVGVISYLLLFGEFPYATGGTSSKNIKRLISEGSKKPSFEPRKGGAQVSEDPMTFAASLLERCPCCRATAANALELPYMSAGGAEECLPSLKPALAHAMKFATCQPRRFLAKDAKGASLEALMQELSLRFQPRQTMPRERTPLQLPGIESESTSAASSTGPTSSTGRTGAISTGTGFSPAASAGLSCPVPGHRLQPRARSQGALGSESAPPPIAVLDEITEAPSSPARSNSPIRHAKAFERIGTEVTLASPGCEAKVDVEKPISPREPICVASV